MYLRIVLFKIICSLYCVSVVGIYIDLEQKSYLVNYERYLEFDLAKYNLTDFHDHKMDYLQRRGNHGIVKNQIQLTLRTYRYGLIDPQMDENFFNSTNKYMQSLLIENIGTFYFSTEQPNFLPYSITFKNITLIETLREVDFKVTDPKILNTRGPLTSIEFIDVNINTIEKNTFRNLTNLKKFVLRNVNVKNIEPYAIEVHMAPGGIFLIEGCNFENVRSNVFNVTGSDVTFRRNKFDLIEIGGIIVNGVANFKFENNEIRTLSRSGIIASASKINFSFNNISKLAREALNKISFDLAHWKLNEIFSYSFVGNSVNKADFMSLNPNLTTFNNKFRLNVKHNQLNCKNCNGIAWILGEFDSLILRFFYQNFLFNVNNNTCFDTFSCDLSLNEIKQLINFDGKCFNVTSGEDICSYKKSKCTIVQEKQSNMVVVSLILLCFLICTVNLVILTVLLLFRNNCELLNKLLKFRN